MHVLEDNYALWLNKASLVCLQMFILCLVCTVLDGYMHQFVATYALLGDALFFGVHFVISNFFF
jgi:hypothetical protein